jgi:hypothetical protein
MPSPTNFPLVFEQLKAILKPYAKNLTITADTSTAYSLDGSYSEKYKKAIFFGAAQIKKNYVSFYLMPVYMFPELLKGVSPELKKHMQGKSCFNFKKVEPDLFKELKQLTRLSVERAREAKNKGEI